MIKSGRKEKRAVGKSVKISVKNSNSRYVALDLGNTETVIAEGTSVEEVTKAAEKVGRPFSMMFIPEPGRAYVYQAKEAVPQKDRLPLLRTA